MRQRVNLLLLALVVICLLSVVFGRSGGDSRQVAATDLSEVLTAAAPAGTREDDAPGEALIHVLVLNGTNVDGLAREQGLALALIGCVVEGVANAPHDHFQCTLVINRRLDEGRARDLARRLGGVQLIAEKDPRCEEDVVLVLGADYEAVGAALAAAADG